MNDRKPQLSFVLVKAEKENLLLLLLSIIICLHVNATISSIILSLLWLLVDFRWCGLIVADTALKTLAEIKDFISRLCISTVPSCPETGLMPSSLCLDSLQSASALEPCSTLQKWMSSSCAELCS